MQNRQSENDSAMHQATEIEIQKLTEGKYIITDEGEIHEYQLLISGSIIENVEVDRDVVHPAYFDVYSKQEEVSDPLLSFSLSQFVKVRVIDIVIPYQVEWNRAIGQISIEYDLDERVNSLAIKFSRIASWHGWPFAF